MINASAKWMHGCFGEHLLAVCEVWFCVSALEGREHFRAGIMGSSCVGLMLMLLVSVPGSGGVCPRQCACSAPAEVHCTFRALLTVPTGISRQVQRINFGWVTPNHLMHGRNWRSMIGLYMWPWSTKPVIRLLLFFRFSTDVWFVMIRQYFIIWNLRV